MGRKKGASSSSLSTTAPSKPAQTTTATATTTAASSSASAKRRFSLEPVVDAKARASTSSSSASAFSTSSSSPTTTWEHANTPVHVRLVIDARHVGRIIGPKGATIAAIRGDAAQLAAQCFDEVTAEQNAAEVEGKPQQTGGEAGAAPPAAGAGASWLSQSSLTEAAHPLFGVYASVLRAQAPDVHDRVIDIKGPLYGVARVIALVGLTCNAPPAALIDATNNAIAASAPSSYSSSVLAASDTTSFSRLLLATVGSRTVLDVRLLVPEPLIGCIIGKQGQTIRQTQASTGCQLKIATAPMPRSTEKAVSVQGTFAQVEQATRQVVSQMLAMRWSVGPTVLYVPISPAMLYTEAAAAVFARYHYHQFGPGHVLQAPGTYGVYTGGGYHSYGGPSSSSSPYAVAAAAAAGAEGSKHAAGAGGGPDLGQAQGQETTASGGGAGDTASSSQPGRSSSSPTAAYPPMPPPPPPAALALTAEQARAMQEYGMRAYMHGVQQAMSSLSVGGHQPQPVQSIPAFGAPTLSEEGESSVPGTASSTGTGTDAVTVPDPAASKAATSPKAKAKARAKAKKAKGAAEEETATKDTAADGTNASTTASSAAAVAAATPAVKPVAASASSSAPASSASSSSSSSSVAPRSWAEKLKGYAGKYPGDPSAPSKTPKTATAMPAEHVTESAGNGQWLTTTVGSPFTRTHATHLALPSPVLPRTMDRFVIPNGCAGGVIGPGGSKVKHLMAVTGASVSITRHPQEVAAAAGQQASANGEGDAAGEAAATGEDGFKKAKRKRLRHPKGGGPVVNDGGGTMPAAAPHERVVTVTGTPQAVMHASLLIRQFVDHWTLMANEERRAAKQAKKPHRTNKTTAYDNGETNADEAQQSEEVAAP